jgi:hypothetical protein
MTRQMDHTCNGDAHTKGSFASVASYTRNPAMPASPTMSGASTCLDDQGKRTPAHVSAIMQELELAMIKMLPLDTESVILLKT